jgi:hypothetical protein
MDLCKKERAAERGHTSRYSTYYKGADILKFIKYENTKLTNDEPYCNIYHGRNKEKRKVTEKMVRRG